MNMSRTTPFRECPRFDKCNVNNCPLHSSYPRIVVDDEDKECKCTMEKQVRFRIGSKYPEVLKFQGLTPAEWAGKRRIENMPIEQLQILRERAKRLKVSACQSNHSQIGIDVCQT